ncbi:hypothetical protein V1511DRAFT_510214 [Dipodascopsis uninucleata]
MSSEKESKSKHRENETEEERAARKLRKQQKKEEKLKRKQADEESAAGAKEAEERAEEKHRNKKKRSSESVEKSSSKNKKKKSENRTEKEQGNNTKEDQTCSNGEQQEKSTVSSTTTKEEAEKFMRDSDIAITDPRNSNLLPLLSFDEVNVDQRILSVLKKYPKPTPIQSASWPYLLAGRDLIGVAETGSGKTMSFAVPATEHILQTKSNSKKGRVSVLIVSPTRELALQIQENLDLLANATKVKSVCVYGGVSKDDQKRILSSGVSVVVATPGRLIDLVNDGAIDLSQVTYLVLDEADRMLEKGFEDDIKRIFNETDASKRRTVMFTATWPQSVRDLASQFLKEPVKVMIGDRESELKANTRIEQVVEVMEPMKKEQRLLQILREYQGRTSKDEKILIFALYKKEAARVERFLQNKGYRIAAIHGDLSQVQRTNALEDFKSGRSTLLLATDVAARGLDIPSVKLVINLTFPLTAEDYVHRIGRTGRAGQTGKAITFFTEHEKHLSGALINVLRAADQPVPEELLKFGGHTKKKEHSVYGAFYKDIDPTKKAKKIVFD